MTSARLIAAAPCNAPAPRSARHPQAGRGGCFRSSLMAFHPRDQAARSRASLAAKMKTLATWLGVKVIMRPPSAHRSASRAATFASISARNSRACFFQLCDGILVALPPLINRARCGGRRGSYETKSTHLRPCTPLPVDLFDVFFWDFARQHRVDMRHGAGGLNLD